MSFWHSLAGQVTITLTSADISALLTAMQTQIRLQNVVFLDELTVNCDILRTDLERARGLCSRRGDSLQVKSKKGLYWSMKQLTGRPVLVAGLLLLLAMSLWVPTRVFFVRVEGNSIVPAKLILERAAECGISFGTSRREVRSEKVKNALLEAMPQLQWAGVNTRGCVAVITVKERPAAAENDVRGQVSSIVASRDGIVEECTVISGSPVCKPGQVVRAGETLISGYTDCGLTIRAGRAEGEIYARTERFLSMISPSTFQYRGHEKRETKKYALLIGKKRINFYKGSGISDTSCVKMYSAYYVTLPGGFVLPVALVTERWTEYTLCVGPAEQPDLSGFAQAYLTGQMVAGRILSQTESLTETDGTFQLTGHYRCLEMIGVRKNEEIIKPYE